MARYCPGSAWQRASTLQQAAGTPWLRSPSGGERYSMLLACLEGQMALLPPGLALFKRLPVGAGR